jgi:hypothetical protein
MKSFASTLTLAAALLVTRPSDACSLEARPSPFPAFLSAGATLEVPPNVALFDGHCIASAIATTRDEPLTLLLGRTVTRPMLEPASGTSLIGSACGRGTLVVMGAADRAAPSEVVLDRVRTIRVRNPSSGAGFGCPELDTLEVHFTTRDDRTPAASLGMLAFVGGTVEEVSTMRVASLVFSPALARPGTPGVSASATHVFRAWLGNNGARRGITPFDLASPMCFSLASMDLAGNVSARSVPRCVDTVNPSDPTVEFVQGSGCSVRGPSRTPSTLGWLAMAAGIVTVIARRRRTR